MAGKICSRRSSPMRPACCRSIRPTRCIGSSRAIRTGSPVAVPAWRPRRRRHADAPPLLRSRATTASSSSTSAAPAARRRWARSSDNTTAHLVADIERLRRHLGIERWVVFGGSWGSTLALAYAEAHPERCRGAGAARHLPLPAARRSTGSSTACARSFPRPGAPSPGSLPEAERGDLLGAYYRRLIDPDPAVHMPAARAWSIYEGACSTLLPSPDTVAAFGEDRMALGPRAHRGALLHARPLSARERPGRASSAASAASRRPSSRAATTWSARSSAPTSWRAPGPRPNTSSCPMPAIRRWSRASAASWSRAMERLKRLP